MSLYVTASEFKQAPTSIDTATLDQTNVGNQAAQDAALTTVLRRASDWVSNICKVDSLEAKSYTETRELHPARDGRLTVFTRNSPLINVSAASYKTAPNQNFSPITLSTNVQPYETWFTIYSLNNGMFLDTYFPQAYYSPYSLSRLSDTAVILQYTYTAGYFNSSLSVAAAIGDPTVSVRSATGLVAGSAFTLYDGASTEYCTVASVAGNVVTLTSPLLFAHTATTPASAVPEPVKEATILLAGFLIRERGSFSVTMNETSIGGISNSYTKAEDVNMATMLLKPYIRRVTS